MGSIQLEELAEFLNAQSGIADNAAHRVRIDRIVARDREDARSIRHNNVRTLAENPKTSFFQCSYGS